jgi:ribonuclease HII
MNVFYELSSEYTGGDDMFVGIDEVGRGALAGPISACACACPRGFISLFSHQKKPPAVIRDSKSMTALQRQLSSSWLKKSGLMYETAYLTPADIDIIGIQQANMKVLRAAAEKLLLRLKKVQSVSILVDYFAIGNVLGRPAVPLQKGDSSSFSIAAASILAKVHRDSLMTEYSQETPIYGWERNKGYGTQEHREAIKRHGKHSLHRKSFL